MIKIIRNLRDIRIIMDNSLKDMNIKHKIINNHKNIIHLSDNEGDCSGHDSHELSSDSNSFKSEDSKLSKTIQNSHTHKPKISQVVNEV